MNYLNSNIHTCMYINISAFINEIFNWPVKINL